MMGLLFARRRPLPRGAMLAGGAAVAYHAGQRQQAGAEHEYEQDQAIAEYSHAQLHRRRPRTRRRQPPRRRPPKPTGSFTQAAFDAEKQKLLSGLAEGRPQGRPRKGEDAMEEFGPVQVLVIGFQDGKFTGAMLDELRRLREHDIARLVDLLFVTKDEDGNVVSIEHSDLTEGEGAELGAIAGALVGSGAEGNAGLDTGAEAGALVGAAAVERGMFGEEDVWYVADAIPEGGSAAIALIEHRWAIPLRDAIVGAGGLAVTDAWVHPRDLVAAGLGNGASGDD